ncbi:MAG: hypothetical protein JWM80_424 [Cyanobacteria bacterium RYN_339]|nr:hypothetical protein [Cyanobacteria bacterium RYN_339]
MARALSLQHFVDAQAPVIDQVRAELRAGRKQSHWMWFVFPQLTGLGSSPMARRFALASLKEAKAYLAHPVLGPRLRECVALVTAVEGRSIAAIMGYPDDLKLRSSLTLFRAADDAPALFQAALDKYYGGEPDLATLALL